MGVAMGTRYSYMYNREGELIPHNVITCHACMYTAHGVNAGFECGREGRREGGTELCLGPTAPSIPPSPPITGGNRHNM